MILYGLLGFTHNSGRTLTVMGPEGARAALLAGDDLAVQAGPGRLAYYREKRRGALRELIAAQRNRRARQTGLGRQESRTRPGRFRLARIRIDANHQC